MHFHTVVIIGIIMVCLMLVGTAMLIPHQHQHPQTHASATSLPTIQIDLSKSLDGRNFGFSGHPHETHLEFIGHRMLTITLPNRTLATFEVGTWQFFQRNGKIISVNLLSSATDINGAYSLASRYIAKWKLPGQNELDTWRDSWNTSQGLSKQRRKAVSDSDNWIGKMTRADDGSMLMVSVKSTFLGPGDHDGWTVVWSIGTREGNWDE
jgi:hypothetical protein